MLGSSILDAAIGMTFVYLLLSLIASAVQEALASIVQARSANLEEGIRSLFSGGTLQDGEPFVDAIYQHGLIRSLYRDAIPDYPLIEGSRTRFHAFWRTLQDLSRRFWRGIRMILRLFLGIPSSPRTSAISDPFLLPSYIPARLFAITLMDLLSRDLHKGKVELEDVEEKLRGLSKQVLGPGGLVENKAAEAMLALLADARNAENALDTFRCSLEDWYSDAMDRVSGWYKKYTQKILLVIGLSLAITFNVDSVRLGRTLWFDKDARQGLVNAAGTYAEKNTPTGAERCPQLAAAGCPSTPRVQTPDDGLTRQMTTTIQAFNEINSKYMLPIGWRYSFKDYRFLVTHPEGWNAIHILEQLLGWLVTALALSFGAPFWFDTLNKFMIVRSTVKPQEKSRNEPSKD